jgi:hypothetical protein
MKRLEKMVESMPWATEERDMVFCCWVFRMKEIVLFRILRIQVD